MKKNQTGKNNRLLGNGPAPTIFDVAEKAGVSPATVSRALSSVESLSRSVEKREKIVAAAKALGYTPNVVAQNLRQMRTNVIAVLGWFKFRSFMSSETLWGIHERLAGTRYAIYMMESNENHKIEEEIFKKLAQTGFACGAILLTRSVRKQTIQLLRKLKMPVVLVENSIAGIDNFTVDNVKGGALAAKHLVEQGCKHIALMAAWMDNPDIRGRALGFKNGLKEAGVSLQGQVSIDPNPFQHDDHYRAGRQAAEKILTLKPRIDGVFCAAGDIAAMGAINYFKEKGLRVPEDIRVIGFDDIGASAYFDPPLTTIHQPAFDLGFESANHMIQILDGKVSTPFKKVMEPHLVVRKSG